ncbi:MAG: type II toxin-antitoxin system RelE/ParE family toxin [Capsulimonadaceae bacterium]|nr:type II toxin-antitoxin system RelE/ParE family toxin [Capsulimonadaceae bacterium]
MIMTFADDETRKVFEDIRSKKLPAEIQAVAGRKLRYLHAATLITELRLPPSNQLEKLDPASANRWSIRINRKWRVCFVWTERKPSDNETPQPGDAYEVEITNHYD